MKIEMLESLGYSYLRHVKNCWIVQANWKASDNWPKQSSIHELDTMFQTMRDKFDGEGSEVFKGARNIEQSLRQAEVDVLGVDIDGEIYALETAFHEGGLNYTGDGGTRGRVLKKLLRTCLVLTAFNAFGGRNHVYFLSPKVNPGTEKDLIEVFGLLSNEYPDIDWRLLVNESFDDEILKQTLKATASMTDTSELFVRAVRLLDTVGGARTIEKSEEPNISASKQRSLNRVEKLQPLVRKIMHVLLERHPSLLHEQWRHKLQDETFCTNHLGFRINKLALLRHRRDGRKISGHARYWNTVYLGDYYVCSQWWSENHLHNANRLKEFLSELRRETSDRSSLQTLAELTEDLSSYIERNSRIMPD